MAENDKRWFSFSDLEKEDYLEANEPDCSFLVGRDADVAKTVECHKFVLSSVSEVFERMFNGDFKEATSCHDIPLTDVEEPQNFQKFLDYLYGKDEELKYCSLETLITIARLGRMYMVEKLHEKCDKLVDSEHMNFKSITNVLSLIEYSCTLETNDLLERVISANKIFGESVTNYAKIYYFDITNFSRLLEMVKDKWTPSTLFYMIERYALQNGLDMQESQKILKTWLGYVDFYKMTISEFANRPMCSKVLNLSDREKLSILVHLCRMKELF